MTGHKFSYIHLILLVFYSMLLFNCKAQNSPTISYLSSNNTIIVRIDSIIKDEFPNYTIKNITSINEEFFYTNLYTSKLILESKLICDSVINLLSNFADTMDRNSFNNLNFLELWMNLNFLHKNDSIKYFMEKDLYVMIVNLKIYFSKRNDFIYQNLRIINELNRYETRLSKFYGKLIEAIHICGYKTEIGEFIPGKLFVEINNQALYIKKVVIFSSDGLSYKSPKVYLWSD